MKPNQLMLTFAAFATKQNQIRISTVPRNYVAAAFAAQAMLSPNLILRKVTVNYFDTPRLLLE